MNYFSAPPRATRQISKFPKHHEALNRCKYRFFVGNVSEVPSQKLTELEKANEEEEVLRTRIVPVAEFLRETDCWKEAIEAEMKQLFEEKEALEKSSLKNLPKEKERGTMVELIPSKLVITPKPGPRRKIRIESLRVGIL